MPIFGQISVFSTYQFSQMSIFAQNSDLLLNLNDWKPPFYFAKISILVRPGNGRKLYSTLRTVVSSLTDQECIEGGTVSFELQLSHSFRPQVPICWMLNAKPLMHNQEQIQISALPNGRYSMTMRELKRSDQGTINFTAGKIRLTAKLAVLLPPFRFLKDLQPVACHVGECVVLFTEVNHREHQAEFYMICAVGMRLSFQISDFCRNKSKIFVQKFEFTPIFRLSANISILIQTFIFLVKISTKISIFGLIFFYNFKTKFSTFEQTFDLTKIPIFVRTFDF